MKGITWLNDLKIRGDYGETGNQDFGSYMSLATMSGAGYVYSQGRWIQVWGPAKNVNPDLKWEKSKNWNVGLDFAVLGFVQLLQPPPAGPAGRL
jgi:outer membrane receptor protein involved in Fe transport